MNLRNLQREALFAQRISLVGSNMDEHFRASFALHDKRDAMLVGKMKRTNRHYSEVCKALEELPMKIADLKADLK